MALEAAERRAPEEGAPEALGPARPRRAALFSAVGLGVVLVLLVTVLATSDSPGGRAGESPLLGRPAPVLEGTSVLAGGGDFALSDQAGRWTVVNFFATWCVPCRAEHPDLLRFAGAHAEAGDARVVSVVFSDEPDEVARFFTEEGGTWPVLEDPVGQIALEWGVTGVPESFLVGPDGTVRAKITGGVDYSGLEALLAQASGRPAARGG